MCMRFTLIIYIINIIARVRIDCRTPVFSHQNNHEFYYVHMIIVIVIIVCICVIYVDRYGISMVLSCVWCLPKPYKMIGR